MSLDDVFVQMKLVVVSPDEARRDGATNQSICEQSERRP